jgi:hypothetical protein
MSASFRHALRGRPAGVERCLMRRKKHSVSCRRIPGLAYERTGTQTDPLRFPSERWLVKTRYPIAGGSQLLVIEESTDRNACSTFLDHRRIGKWPPRAFKRTRYARTSGNRCGIYSSPDPRPSERQEICPAPRLPSGQSCDVWIHVLFKNNIGNALNVIAHERRSPGNVSLGHRFHNSIVVACRPCHV